MDRLEFADIELTYDRREGRDRVLLVHASPFVSWYQPLVEQLPARSTLTFRRRLRKPAAGPYRPLTVAEDAATSVRLMDTVGWPDAHVVGHSYGALVALQMAMVVPERVSSVVLLEPAARGVSSSAAIAAALQPVIAAYRSGDTKGAVDGFLRHVCGDDYRADLDRVVPQAFNEALAEADLFFQAEMAAVQQWSFGPADAARIERPVLDVIGNRSAQRFQEGSALIRSWIPSAEHLSIPDAGHLLMIQNSSAVARGLIEFIERHPAASTDQPAVTRVT